MGARSLAVCLAHRVHSHNVIGRVKIGRRSGVNFGRRLTVTFLLFVATLALWWSTRRLVSGAEFTAKRQLRAYVNVAVARASPQGDLFRYYVEVKNFGQTPAYDVTLRYGIRWCPFPLTETLSLPDL